MAALPRVLVVAASLAIHAGGAAFALTGVGHAPVGTPTEIRIEVEPLPLDTPKPTVPAEPLPTAPSRAIPTHTHPYPVPASHDAQPHPESLKHTPSPAEAPAPHEPAAHDEPEAVVPHFAMTLGPQRFRVTSAAPAAPANATYTAAEVAVPARLVSSVSPVYPAAARSDDLEGHVAVELVVEADGRVSDARVVASAGHGFDEAALEAVRRYVFSPAERDGHRVRVRMPWTVQFRLR
jgi:protein TonB